MTAQSLLPRWFPAIYLLGLGILVTTCSFNGLYGQDAHEYVRQCQVILQRWQGLPTPAPGIGDAELAGGYPLAGALLGRMTGNVPGALQWVSMLSAALTCLVFERLLRLLSPGSRVESRWIFTGLGLSMAPLFLRAALTVMSDAFGMLLLLSVFLFGLGSLEKKNAWFLPLAVLLGAFAVSTRYALVALVLPIYIWLGWNALKENRWLVLGCSVLAGILGLWPHFWLKLGGSSIPLGHSLLQDWSLWHFLQSSFNTLSGQVAYTFPNALYLLFPLAHPGFLLHLPLLFLLWKKTDIMLSEKKMLLVCLLTYLLLLGGLPHQNLRYLLPVYLILLLLLFPAWDRMYCYGLIFFRKITLGLIAVTMAVQLFFCTRTLWPVLHRNHLELEIATRLQEQLPAGATLYAFDLEPAMRTYLTKVNIRSLWEQRYVTFESGAYILFKESLRSQWEGKAPVQNWDTLRAQHQLEEKAGFAEGWVLWEIR
ncbi:MAG: hypothetical protein JNN28_12835 [Saprospiraceae bacterium]|nr:hypothetical protein [Saprospiraceae bacterium]